MANPHRSSSASTFYGSCANQSTTTRLSWRGGQARWEEGASLFSLSWTWQARHLPSIGWVSSEQKRRLSLYSMHITVTSEAPPPICIIDEGRP